MEEENFVANSKGNVKALGMKINCAATDLHIYVNGVDIAKKCGSRRGSHCSGGGA